MQDTPLAGGGLSADARCDYLNAFTDYDQAAAWMRMYPIVRGRIVTSAQAERLARQIFADLLIAAHERPMRRGPVNTAPPGWSPIRPDKHRSR